MKKTPQFFVVYILTLILVLSIVPVVNIVTDYSRVFHRDYNALYKERRENTGFLKVAYLIDRRKDFDSLIFGSSRVRFGFNTAILQKKLGGKWFKLWYPGGIPYQHYQNLRALLDNDVIPHRVMLALNDFDMWTTGSEQEFNQNYNRRQYPLGFLDWIRFYSFYMLKKPGKIELDILRGAMPLKRSQRITGEMSGYSASKNYNEKKRSASLLARYPYHDNMADRKYDFDESIYYIEKIVRLCEEHGIKLYLVNLPSPLKNLAARNFSSIEMYKKELVSLSPFYDFSGFYPIVNRPQYWFELNHFGRDLGDIIIDGIAGEKLPPGRFGAYVTDENIDLHQKMVREAVVQAIPALLTEDIKTIISRSLLGEEINLIVDAERFITETRGGGWLKKAPNATLSAESSKASFTLRVPPEILRAEHYVVRLDLTVPHNSTFKIMARGGLKYTKRLKRGDNRIYFYTDAEGLSAGLRIMPGKKSGKYVFKGFDLFSLTSQ